MDKKYSQNNNSKSSKPSGGNYFKDKFGKSKPTGAKSPKSDFGDKKGFKKSEGESEDFGGFKGKKPFKPKFQDRDNNFKGKSSFRGDKDSFPKKRFDKDNDFSKGKKYGDSPFNKDNSFKKENDFGNDKPYWKSFKNEERDNNSRGEKSFDKDRSYKGGKPFKKDNDFKRDKPFRDENGTFPKKKFDKEGDFSKGKKYGDKPFGKDKYFKKDKDFSNDKPFKKSFDRDGVSGERGYGKDKPFNKDKGFRKDKSFDNERTFDKDKKFGNKPFRKDYSDKRNGEQRPHTDGDSFEGKREPKAKKFNVRKFEQEDLSFGNSNKPQNIRPKTDEVEVIKSLDEPEVFVPKKWNKVDKSARGPKEKGFRFEEERRFKKPADINNYRSEPLEDIEDDNTKPMPLNKFLAHCGICSRRDAVDLVKTGEVKVNGVAVIEPGFKVDPLVDKVSYKDKDLNIQEELVYILMNKPKGFITTMDDPQNRKTVWDLVKNNIDQRVFPIGRLDRNTTGLLLLTNDGQLAQKLSHPKYQIRKIYQATLDKNLTHADFEKILAGVVLEDGPAPVDSLSYLETKNEIGLEIHSGKNRVVRRIFESLGYEVEKLDRVMYAGLTKKNILRGKFRFLSEQEVINLKYLK